MSWPGRQVVAAMDAALDAHEQEVARRRWWTGYSRRLTDDERSRIRSHDFRAIRRPYKPEFQPGEWLDAGPKIRVRVAEIQPKRGGYRIIIDRVQDFRATHGERFRRLREDMTTVETLMILGNPSPPEPEPVDAQWLRRFRDIAEIKQAHWVKEAITGER